MYQGMQSQIQGYSNNYYQNANPYGAQYQQRYTPMETAQAAYATFPSGNFIKGRPVVSMEEARASQIDLDGSLHVFTDIGNKKIYTKQLNLDGTAALNTYVLEEDIKAPLPEFVTKEELELNLGQLRSELEMSLSQLQSQIQSILNTLNAIKEEKKSPIDF